jgi:hypothetical protein
MNTLIRLRPLSLVLFLASSLAWGYLQYRGELLSSAWAYYAAAVGLFGFVLTEAWGPVAATRSDSTRLVARFSAVVIAVFLLIFPLAMR